VGDLWAGAAEAGFRWRSRQRPSNHPNRPIEEAIMAKLILKRFQCVIDTNELGSESPYFLTFVGDFATGKTALKLTRQGNWHNEVDQGETWIVNETVADGFDLVPTKTVVLSAMVEEDEGLDVNSVEINMIRSVLTARLNTLRQAGVTLVNATIANLMASTMKTALQLALSSASGADDDYMGTRRVPITGQSGDLQLITFNADSGLYRVRYAQG
jgi:hypothetical protein